MSDVDGDASGSIWLRSPRTTRERETLTRDRIVKEAVALLDQEGVTRLTMRRLAERLETGSTTLYWHVDTKHDVLDLALDAIIGEVPVPAEHGYWRDDLFDLIVAWRATMLRHPWTAALLGRPMIGPNVLARMEFLQASLTRAGLEGEHLAAATWALHSQVMGSAAAQATFPMQPDERRAAQDHLRAHHDRYPTLAANDYMLDDDWHDNVIQGLNYLLDGIERQATSNRDTRADRHHN